MLVLSIVIITFALIFYSVGIWGERIQRTLNHGLLPFLLWG